MLSNIPKVKEIYRHFKGNLYQIVAIATHSETGEELVIYQAMYGEQQVYARPLSMFFDKVDKDKYPNITQEYRFELQEKKQEEIVDTQWEIDPLVLEFIEADTYEQRLNILASLHHRITDEMITTMAVSCDVEVSDGDIEERYEGLKTCLLTLDKYECNRLR